LKLTAIDLLEQGVVDEIVREPVGGAHKDPATAVATTAAAVRDALADLRGRSPEELVAQRAQRFRQMGRVLEASA
jgi:acetyl-CoA carboxylase carboxyl transferase subunit alpha